MLQMRSDDEVGGIHSARMTLSHTKAGWQRSAPVVFAKKFFGHGVHDVLWWLSFSLYWPGGHAAHTSIAGSVLQYSPALQPEL